jgi:hypothetical protein
MKTPCREDRPASALDREGTGMPSKAECCMRPYLRVSAKREERGRFSGGLIGQTKK